MDERTYEETEQSLFITEVPEGTPRVRNAFDPRIRVYVDFSEELDRTKQSFKDQQDIKNILKKFQETGILPEQTQNQVYGDELGLDFTERQQIMASVRSSYHGLDPEIQANFDSEEDYIDALFTPERLPDLVAAGLADPIPSPEEPGEGEPSSQDEDSQGDDGE